MLAYSAYDACVRTYGHVKLNGSAVWQASWCGEFLAIRGVTIILVDPISCTIRESRNFDTYGSSTDATELSNYLKLVEGGSVIVGVTADEPAKKLYNALSALQDLGVDVSDVRRRGSFAFVAQKGHPSKTLIYKVLTEEESHRAPAHLTVIVAGMCTITINVFLLHCSMTTAIRM